MTPARLIIAIALVAGTATLARVARHPDAVPLADGTSGQARRLIVRKNRDRAVVLYWYAIHGRMLANEVASKAWLLHDSLWFRRSDAALVRIVVPVGGADAIAAEQRGLTF